MSRERSRRTPCSAPSTRRLAPATPRIEAVLREALPILATEGLGGGARVLVGVSGGQDSLCLVHALWRLRVEHGWVLHVIHVDHGIRAAAAAEATYVTELCRAWGLPMEVARLDVPTYRRRERLNLQEAARYARYQAFARCAQRLDAAAVAVGHTADDVAETLLLHLLRGAGLDGLAAPPLRQTLPRAALGPSISPEPLPPAVVVTRPLLRASRADTAAYCAEQGMTPVAEPEAHYQRDRMRSELLPFLERYNPAVRWALAEAAFALAEERAARDATVDRLWASLPRRDDGAVVFPLDAWQATPTALQRRLLQRAVAERAGADAVLGRRVQAAALRLARAQPGRGVDLPYGLRLKREPDALRLAPRPGLPPPLRGETAGRGETPATWPLAVPGRVVLPGVGTIRAGRRATAPAVLPPARAPECWLDATVLTEPLGVRFRRPGDRFQPLGMPEPKRLQNFLVDAGVPRALRDRLPLVVCGDAIAWVVGWRVAEWARVRPDSAAVVHLAFEADR